MHEVVAPNVISIRRTQPHTRSVIEPQSSSFRLFLRHFQAVSSPKSFDTFVIHFPTSSSQSFGHPTIAVPTVLLCQPNHLPYQTWLVFWNMGLTTLGGSGLMQHPTRTTFRNPIEAHSVTHVLDHPTTLRRSQKFPEAASRRTALSSSASATSFFKPVFSHSNSFRRFA